MLLSRDAIALASEEVERMILSEKVVPLGTMRRGLQSLNKYKYRNFHEAKISFFGFKLRFCLFCLEYILLVEVPRGRLKSDLNKLKREGTEADAMWAERVRGRFNI